ncbi:MAG TPA: hypothetical protein VIT62_13810 [Lysobacter sp.]
MTIRLVISSSHQKEAGRTADKSISKSAILAAHASVGTVAGS